MIPERFFNLFAGKNRHIYAEAVLLLYDQYQINRFGIDYGVMRDLIQEMLEAQEAIGLRFETDDEQELSLVEIDVEYDLFRLQAGVLLRRLREQQWIDVETRESFRQYIVLPHYSSRILAVLKELCTERTVEYQRFAFATYQLLTGDEAKKQPSLAVLEAAQITGRFLEELRVLFNNMKHHMEQVVAKTSIQEVLDHHFDEYKAKIVDRSYHRLKTSDHVSRYRHRIRDTVQRWLLDRDLFEETIKDALSNELFSSHDEAEQRLWAALLSIEEAYDSLDEIFYQIDLRHNQYLHASFDRARYLSGHSHGMDQRLARLLEWLSGRQEQDGAAQNSSVPGLFLLFQMDQVAGSSLYSPRRRRAPHKPEPHEVVFIPEEWRKQLREENLARMEKVLTRDRVRDYVLDRLDGREAMRVSELAPRSPDEFLYLAYVYLYGYDGMSEYRLHRSENDRIHSVGGFRFHDRRLERNRPAKGESLK